MSITSTLYKLARLSADFRAIRRCFETRSLMPLVRRIANKAIGRGVVSKMIWRK